MSKKTKDPNRLGFGRMMAWQSSNFTASWVSLLALNYLSIYASDTLGINVGIVGTLLLASKIVDAITDVISGWLVDNTHTRWGKGRPYELCIIGMTISTIAMFSCSPEWSMVAKCAWIFTMYTFTFSIFTTLRTAGSTAYLIRHFSNNVTMIRKVSSWVGILTMVGSMALSIAFPILMGRIATSASGWTTLVAAIMIPATFIALFRFLFCKEDPQVDANSNQEPIRFQEIFEMFKKNKYTWLYAIIMLCYNVCTGLAAGTYYFKWIIGNTDMLGVTSLFSVVLLPAMFIFPKLMKKIGSMGKMIAYFCVIGVVGYGIIFFSGSNVTGVLIGFLMGNFATMPLAYYNALFIMNICTYNEMIGLARMDGSAGILSNFASKVGGAIGAWVTGILLSIGGYISQAGVTSQPTSALMMIRIDYAIVPLILVVIIGGCCLAFSKMEVKAEAWQKERNLSK